MTKVERIELIISATQIVMANRQEIGLDPDPNKKCYVNQLTDPAVKFLAKQFNDALSDK